MFDPLTIGMISAYAVGFGIDAIQGKILHDHTKALEQIKGSENVAASAYNKAEEAAKSALDAATAAATANQHAAWLHAELDKKKVLPEMPKSDAEIKNDYMQAMAGFMKAFAESKSSTEKTVKLDPATVTAIVAAVQAANDANSKK